MHPKVFISYSHKDQAALERLQTFLRPLERNALLDRWSDDKLRGGDDWATHIDQALSAANVAVLLVSPDFLASEFIVGKELPRLLAREAAGELTVLPVFLSPSPVAEIEIVFADRKGQEKRLPLSRFQGYGTPQKTLAELSWSDQERQYVRLAEQLKSLTGMVESRARPARGGLRLTEPPQERTYPLIIELERRDEALEVRTRLPELEVMTRRRLPWSSVRDEIEALHQRLDHGDQDALRELVRDSGLGERLFELLFGDEKEWRPVLRRVFGRGEAANPNPEWRAVRLTVRAEHDRLAHLPWRLLRFRGRLLAESGWVILSALGGDPEANLHTTPPANVLIVAAEQPGRDHPRALRELFAKIWPTGQEQRYLTRVATRPQLEQALRTSRPHLLYIHGEGGMDGAEGTVLLDRPDGQGREPLELGELAALIAATGHRPQAIYFNVAGWSSVPEPSPARLFAPTTPLVVWRRLSAFQPDSTAHALEWLRRWLGDGRDPVAALRPLRQPLPLTVEAATVLMHAAYSSWHTPVYRTTALRSAARLRLDRVNQRALVRKYLAELARSDSQRVLTLVSYAAPGNALKSLWEQLRYELDLELADIPINWQRLLFPVVRDDLRWSLRADLETQLKAGPDEPLQGLLSRHAPKGAGVRRGILWLDWGTFGAGSEHGPELEGPQLSDWIRFASELLCNHCSADLRLVCHLGLEIEAERHDGFGQFLQKQRLKPWSKRPQFQLRPLQPLDAVTEEDLFDYLEDPKSQCPPGIVEDLAQRIMTTTTGVFEPTVTLLEEAERGSCYALLERLQRDQGAEVEEEIETW